MKRLSVITVGICTLFLLSCSDETGVPQEDTSVWNQYELPSSTQSVVNSMVADGHLSLISLPRFITVIDPDHQIVINEELSLLRYVKPGMGNGFIYDYELTPSEPADTGRVSVGYFGDYSDPDWEAPVFYISKYDSDFKSYFFDVNSNDDYGAYGENQFLINYLVKSSRSQLNYALISYSYLQGQAEPVRFEFEITDFDVFQMEVASQANALLCNGNFFISLAGEGLYLIQNGETQKSNGVDSFISSMFYYQGEYHAVSTTNVHKSTDGLNWQHTMEFPFRLDNGEFIVIDDKVAFATRNEIYQVSFSDNTLLELANSGLEGRQITSIDEHNNRIYLGTTFNEMYYKSKESFFTLKGD